MDHGPTSAALLRERSRRLRAVLRSSAEEKRLRCWAELGQFLDALEERGVLLPDLATPEVRSDAARQLEGLLLATIRLLHRVLRALERNEPFESRRLASALQELEQTLHRLEDALAGSGASGSTATGAP